MKEKEKKREEQKLYTLEIVRDAVHMASMAIVGILNERLGKEYEKKLPQEVLKVIVASVLAAKEVEKTVSERKELLDLIDKLSSESKNQ